MSLAKLSIDIEAKLSSLEQGMRKATTIAERNAKKIDSAFAGLKSTAMSIGAALGGAFAVRELVEAADKYASLNARLKLVTASTREFEVAQAELFAMAQNTRVGLEQTTDLYASLVRSTESLGVSQGELLGVTQTINQALVVSGASATSAAAALVQLGQGFAAGALRGEELNSVLEQAPRLAKAIADGLGVPIGKLREMGKAGELTAEKVFGALQKSSGAVQREFEQMPLTVGQATTKTGNALLKLIGVMDQTSGASSGLAQAISSAAESISGLADELNRASSGESVGFLAEAIMVVSETVQVLAAELSYIFKATGRKIGAIAAQIEALSRLDIAGFTAISDAVTEDAKKARAEVDKLVADILARKPKLNLSGERMDAFSDPRSALFGKKNSGGGGDEGGKKKRDPYADAVKSLREQVALVGKDTELAKLNERIKLGAYGRLSDAQAQTLRNLAGQLDMRNQELDADEKAKKSAEERLALQERIREATAEAVAASLKSRIDEADGIAEGNQALREEIEILAGGEKARRAIERARISSTIALKEEALALLQTSEGTEAEIRVMEKQIALLKERAGLLGKKGAAEEAQEALKQADEFTKQAQRTIQASVAGSIKSAFKGEFDGILKMWGDTLLEMAAQAAATKLNQYLFGDILSGGKTAGVLSFLFHSGGIVGSGGGSSRTVSPLAFAGAPRYHSGGIAGDEVPAILKRGEEVLTANDPRHRKNGGGGSVVNNISVGAGVTRNEVMSLMQLYGAQLKGEILGSMRNGGAFAR